MNNQVIKLVEYILDNYSEYIDKLQIQKLMYLLKDRNGDLHRYLDRAIKEIVQFIVDDLGCDIVNKIEVLDNLESIYVDVTFKDPVVINKNKIASYEFFGASFLKGVTIKNRHLPHDALSDCAMSGVVDLTEVEILGRYNLDFESSPEICKVLLSSNLKTFEEPEVLVFPDNVEVEYRGTMLQFTSLVNNHYKIWDTFTIKYFERKTEHNKIKCNDGIWTIDEYHRLAKTLK